MRPQSTLALLAIVAAFVTPSEARYNTDSWKVIPDYAWNVINASANCSVSNAHFVTGYACVVAPCNSYRQMFISSDGATLTNSVDLGAEIRRVMPSSYAYSSSITVTLSVAETVPFEFSGAGYMFCLGMYRSSDGSINIAYLFRFTMTVGASSVTLAMSPSTAVFTGATYANYTLGVPDLYDDGTTLYLMYTALGLYAELSRVTYIATSTDAGVTWTETATAPFSAWDSTATRPSDLNVDAAPIRLLYGIRQGTYMTVTMRGGYWYIWVGSSPTSFTQTATTAIAATIWGSDGSQLFDPNVLQLPNGSIYVYGTRSVTSSNREQIVRAELVPPHNTYSESPSISLSSSASTSPSGTPSRTRRTPTPTLVVVPPSTTTIIIIVVTITFASGITVTIVICIKCTRTYNADGTSTWTVTRRWCYWTDPPMPSPPPPAPPPPNSAAPTSPPGPPPHDGPQHHHHHQQQHGTAYQHTTLQMEDV